MVIQVPARGYYALFRLLRLFTLHCTRKRSVVKGEATQQTRRSVALDLAGEVGETYLLGAMRTTTACGPNSRRAPSPCRSRESAGSSSTPTTRPWRTRFGIGARRPHCGP